MTDPKTVLEYLADPNNWHGNPHDQRTWLYGHETPYEMAREALGLPLIDEYAYEDGTQK